MHAPLAPFLLALLPLATLAQQPVFQSPDLVVTATRTPRIDTDALASVTVIRRTDIERSQATSLTQVLQGSAGIDVVQSGGQGSLTSVFTRGTESDHTLVLIDGIPAGSVTSGGFSWEFLPVDQIERIEIVRGPRSTLYGSDAIGGVVQIFTRRGGGQDRYYASGSLGNRQTARADLGTSGSLGAAWYSLNAGHFSTAGIDARSPTLEFGFLPLDEPDHDGYRNSHFSGRLGYRLPSGAELEIQAVHAQGRTQFDSSGNNQEDFLLQTLGTTLRLQPRDSWDMSLRLGRSLDERKQFRSGDAFAKTRFNSEKLTASWQNDFQVRAEDLLTLGLDYLDDRASGSTNYKEDSRYTVGVFGQYQAFLGRSELIAALRHDDNQQFGGHTTGSLSWGLHLGEDHLFTLSYATAFKAPTFNDLYFPDFFGFPTSNPELDPERSRTAEAGVKGSPSWGSWGLSVYETRIHDLISLDDNFLPQNLNRARIHGLEIEFDTRLWGWQVAGQASYLDPRDQRTDKLLRRRSQRSLRLDLDRSFGPLQLGATLLNQGRRFDDAANQIQLHDYTLVHLRAAWTLHRTLTLRASVRNLLDEHYQVAESFNQPDRSYLLTLAWQSR